MSTIARKKANQNLRFAPLLDLIARLIVEEHLQEQQAQVAREPKQTQNARPLPITTQTKNARRDLRPL